jgi:hypothetical protein
MSFQIIIANSALCGQLLRSGETLAEDTIESLWLYNRAIELLYERLYDPEQHTTEDMMWSMCGFLTHDVSFCVVPALLLRMCHI